MYMSSDTDMITSSLYAGVHKETQQRTGASQNRLYGGLSVYLCCHHGNYRPFASWQVSKKQLNEELERIKTDLKVHY